MKGAVRCCVGRVAVLGFLSYLSDSTLLRHRHSCFLSQDKSCAASSRSRLDWRRISDELCGAQASVGPTACETRVPGCTGDKSVPWYDSAQPCASTIHDRACVAPSCTHPRHTRETTYWKTVAGQGRVAAAAQRRSTPPCVPKTVENHGLENGQGIKVHELAPAIPNVLKIV